MNVFADPVTLTGPLVRLVPLRADHHDALVEAVRDGELWNAWYTSVPTPEEMAVYIQDKIAAREAGTANPWVVARTADDQVLGVTTFLGIDPLNRRVEIGATWQRAGAQGTGANPAAKLLLLGHAFDDLDAIAVELRTHFHNRQSRAAIERLGAKLDGVLRSHQIGYDGTLRDTVVYSITAAEWPTVRVGLEHRLRARLGD
ncbi:GNAT family N-acetyltransferase [Oerskovia rustica]|uniref:GNAT family N-acetyltransferase n=1 Tax=Oerskovia rustica TaxID=2762237 RepID=A0ABR8RRJ1_9CELL|nr:GNAT family protein [Oerskovia rustica]MBD7950339.1 GNAT family N-acetyltransferase [Oerskovia rustica]